MTTEKFDTFNTIKHLPLRVFNRTIYFSNILSDFGKDTASEYLEQFNEAEKKQMYIMQVYIKKFGYEFARKKAVEGWEPEDNEETVLEN